VTGRTARRLGAVLVFAAGTVPLVLVGLDAGRGRLGANPIEAVLNRLGYWALAFLLIALAPTPLAKLTGWTWPARYRRMLGLFAFFYGCAHFAFYAGVDQFFDWHAMGADIVKRKFITIGMLTLALLVPLASTSTNRSVRRLGYVRWKRLHRLVYLAAVCGVVHFVWRVKADLREPLVFASLLVLLLLLRLAPRRRRTGREPAALSPRPAGER
jgi:methionine sulfoxide reductase heme-binding subunit